MAVNYGLPFVLKRKMKKTILLAVAAAILMTTSCAEKKQTLRIVTYNVGVFHKADINSIPMVSDMMKEIDADVMGINELDSCTVRTGGEYQIESFAKAMGDWNFRYASTIDYQGGKYGIGVASKPKFEILSFHKIPLPRGGQEEPRALAVAEFRDFILATTHLDYTSDAVQTSQADAVSSYLKDKYGDCGKAVFLTGDMNAAPESAAMMRYKKDWTILSAQDYTIPAVNPRLCIDYIMLLNGTAECKVLETAVLTEFKKGDVKIASDHLPVMAVVQF